MERQVQVQAPKEASGYRLVLTRRLASEPAPDSPLVVPATPQFWALNPFQAPDDLRLQDGQLYRIVWVDAQGMPVSPPSRRYVPALRFLLGPPNLDSMTEQDEYESILELVDYPQLRPRYEKEIADLRLDRLRQQHKDEAEQRMQALTIESRREMMARLNEETQHQTALEDQRRAERRREEQEQRAREQQAAAAAERLTQRRREKWLAIGIPLLAMAGPVLIPKIQEWLGLDFRKSLGENIKGILSALTSQQSPLPPLPSKPTHQALTTSPAQAAPQALPPLSREEEAELLEILSDRNLLQVMYSVHGWTRGTEQDDAAYVRGEGNLRGGTAQIARGCSGPTQACLYRTKPRVLF